MKREEIEEKYKWDLSRMYKTEEDFMQDFKEVKDELPNIEKYKGKFLETSDRFIEFMNLLEKVNRKLEKMYTYAHLAVDVEPENGTMQNLSANVLGLLEEVGNNIDGVDKAYALQAGRELRVVVKPEEVDDAKAHKIARDVKEKIEATMKYPGTIKITVVRETRAQEEAK